jgi:chitin disaccharide deacetylase
MDWHTLADGGRPNIFDVGLKLARTYGLALRVHDRRRARELQAAGLPTVDYDLLDSYRLGSVDKTARLIQLLRDLPPGLSEWAVHPNLGDAEARALEPDGWRIHKADFDFLLAPEPRAVLAKEGIILLDYRPLQALWSR